MCSIGLFRMFFITFKRPRCGIPNTKFSTPMLAPCRLVCGGMSVRRVNSAKWVSICMFSIQAPIYGIRYGHNMWPQYIICPCLVSMYGVHGNGKRRASSIKALKPGMSESIPSSPKRFLSLNLILRKFSKRSLFARFFTIFNKSSVVRSHAYSSISFLQEQWITYKWACCYCLLRGG